MPYDSNGHFTRVHNWEDDRANDIDIVTDHHDAEDDNFAEGLSQAFLKDGRAAMSGDLNVGGFKVKNMSVATNATDAVNKSQLDALQKEMGEVLKSTIEVIFSIGDIKTSLQTDNHNNWLLCDGQAVKRTDYEDLFALIGTNFGTGDGITTFNVPDYRGKFLRGLGGDSESDFYKTQDFAMQGHTHSYETQSRHGSHGVGAYPFWSDGDVSSGNAKGIMSLPEKHNDYGDIKIAKETRPTNQAINYFIKAKMEE